MPDPKIVLDRATEILGRATSVVVSTGAGISQESGIPTFRDAPSALWAKYDPGELATREGFAKNPSLVWRWYAERRVMISRAEPNAGHRAIADFEALFDDFVVITQNIDDLHRRAGTKRLVEIHGNIFRYKCFEMNHAVEISPHDNRSPPRCHCGSLIRPDVVWFGEMLPETGIEEAYEALDHCDAILVVGTSGTVHPAAGFSSVAKEHGASIVEVNPEETPLSPMCEVSLRDAAATAVPMLLAGC